MAVAVLSEQVRELVDEGAEVEQIATGFTFTEGPIWMADGSLYFSDMPGDKRRRWHPEEGVTVLLENQPVFSCLVPVSTVGTRRVRTLESLGTAAEPGPVQRAFVEEQAAQCGYCIAGMVMRAQALLERNPSPSRQEILRHMSPNLCRCGTHMRILRAVGRAAELMRGGAK